MTLEHGLLQFLVADFFFVLLALMGLGFGIAVKSIFHSDVFLPIVSLDRLNVTSFVGIVEWMVCSVASPLPARPRHPDAWHSN